MTDRNKACKLLNIVAFFLLGCCAFSPFKTFAQLQTKNWYFGNYAGLVFEKDGLKADTNGSMRAGENCTAYSDPCTGELLFYSNGESIWGADHEFIENGQGLLGSTTTSQGVLIFPAPGHDQRYYCFTSGGSSFEPSTEYPNLSVSIIDRKGQDGDWRVWIKNKHLIDSTGEKVAATQTCDGKGYWVATHHIRLNTFYISKIDASNNYTRFDTIRNMGYQPPHNGSIHPSAHWFFSIGGMKFSPDGSHLCLISERRGYAELFKFDNSTGQLSDPIKIDIPPPVNGLYGCEFSPDSRKLYLTRIDNFENVIQYDVSIYNKSAVESSYTAVNGQESSFDGNGGYQSVQLALDGRIYVGDSGSRIDVVNNPNAKGLSCEFIDSATTLLGRGSIGSLPAFVSSWLAQPPDAGLECAKPHVKFEADTILCAGEYLKLNDLTRRNPADWSWTFEGGEPATFDGPEPPEILYRNPGLFAIKLIAENDNGADSGEVVVQVNPRPQVDAGPDLTVCRGESVQLLATGAARYEWRADAGIGDVNSPEQNFTPDVSGEYVVCGWNELDCMDCDTVLVSVAENLTAEAGEDVQICRGESVVLNGSGGAEYLWTPAAGLDDNRSATPTASPRNTTLYRLRVGSGACQAVDSVLVEVLDVPDVNAGPDQTICPGETARLNASGAQRYEWSPAAGLDDVNSATPNAAPTATQTYRVLGFNNSGCVDSAFVSVNVVNELDVQLEVPEPVCRGSVVQLSASGAQSYSWEPEGLFDDANSPTPRLTVEENVTVSVTGHSGGCEASVEIELEVLPDPLVNIEPVAEICAGESAQLRASGAMTYRWEPADGLDDVNSATPRAAPRQTTVYTVTGVDNNGCEAEAAVTVTVRPAAELLFEVVRLNDRPATPGEERMVQIRLAGDATDIEELNISDLSLTLEYPLNGLVLRRGHEDVLPGWTWTATEDLAANQVEFKGESETTLTSGTLFQLPLTVFQFPYDSLFANIEIVATSLSGACVDVQTIPGGIPLSPVCLSQSRNIGLTGVGFGLQAPRPNPASGSFDLEFTIGFEVNTTVEIYNTLGRRVAVLADERLAAGEHVRRVADLPAGVYQIVMRAGPFSAVRSVVVGE